MSDWSSVREFESLLGLNFGVGEFRLLMIRNNSENALQIFSSSNSSKHCSQTCVLIWKIVISTGFEIN